MLTVVPHSTKNMRLKTVSVVEEDSLLFVVDHMEKVV